MGRLKGQNLRVFSGTTVIGASTNCVVTLTNNLQEVTTKDDVGGAQKQEVMSTSWTVQVDSMAVQDIATLLTAMKAGTPFTLSFDKVATSNNQTPAGEGYALQGSAFLTDLTVNFNDREYSVKSLTFTGTGGLTQGATISATTITSPSKTRGEEVRLFVGVPSNPVVFEVIAAAKTLQLHVSVSTEVATTKDTTGMFDVIEPTGLAYDISTSALVSSGETITSEVPGIDFLGAETYVLVDNIVKWKICNVQGDNNRSAVSEPPIVQGDAIVQQLTVNAQNRQVATYTLNLTGNGDYTVGNAS